MVNMENPGLVTLNFELPKSQLNLIAIIDSKIPIISETICFLFIFNGLKIQFTIVISKKF